jgi:2-polyprenyl-6-methoxyphenol hydroxylase-like FAD-dependent oxidoreductase
VHVTVDPLLAQGANIGSYSAFALADAIEEAEAFDLRFCDDVQRCRATRILGASRWTNAFLQPPDAARVELMAAMSRDRRLAQEYFENFSRPDRQWERVGSAERIRNWLDMTQMHSLELAAATANS